MKKESTTKTIYRIRTQKEFEKEFGRNWRHKLDLFWLSPSMDILFGKKISKKSLSYVEEEKKTRRS